MPPEWEWSCGCRGLAAARGRTDAGATKRASPRGMSSMEAAKSSPVAAKSSLVAGKSSPVAAKSSPVAAKSSIAVAR